MAREELAQAAEFHDAQGEEGEAGQDGREGEGEHCRRDEDVVVDDVLLQRANNGVEEGLRVARSSTATFFEKAGHGGRTTTSIIMEPFPPAKIEPPLEKTSCATMQETKN